MSHIVTVKTQIRDREALAAACRRLALNEPQQGTARLFSGEVSGLLVRLPGWRYPVVADVTRNELHYDNYGGQWGAQEQLHRLLQAYAVEKARLEARKAGYTVTEQPLPDGSIKLTVQAGGAA
jgi:hypothetical protein